MISTKAEAIKKVLQFFSLYMGSWLIYGIFADDTPLSDASAFSILIEELFDVAIVLLFLFAAKKLYFTKKGKKGTGYFFLPSKP